ncbi:MAG: ACP S-malonyltransferase [Deltaproteobacteria bacterium]|nr:ACP S-malonyltransferase [Deltaproteobacteria bacterium]
MKRVAYLCPGQGAQQVGMGEDLCREFPVAGDAFAEADEALGFGLRALCAEGPQEKLTLTENAQPALLATSVAIARILESEGGLVPQIAAGHSLGEWSAWVIVGALSFPEALRAVRQRGRFMQEAVPAGVGAMTALLGADLATAEELCREASTESEVVVPANLNGGGQIVVAGHLAALERLEAVAPARKIRASRLQVSAPFHSPLMAPAAKRLEPVLAELGTSAPRAPVVTNVEAKAERDPARIGPLLLEQITGPVRWEECARAVIAEADAALEVGPGRVLSGLLRRIERSFACAATSDVAGVRAVLAEHAA